MNEIQKAKITSKIECYYIRNKGKKEESCKFIFDKRFGVIFKNKGDKSTFVVSTEKKFLRTPKSRFTKKISLDDATEKLISICFAQQKAKGMPAEDLGFAMVMIEKLTKEITRMNIEIDPNVFQDVISPLSQASQSIDFPPSPIPAPTVSSIISNSSNDGCSISFSPISSNPIIDQNIKPE